MQSVFNRETGYLPAGNLCNYFVIESDYRNYLQSIAGYKKMKLAVFPSAKEIAVLFLL